MLILKTVAQSGPMHGFEIASAILQTSREVLRVEEGSLYPALARMLARGWLAGEWGRTPDNRRARYYQVTRSGRKQLAEELERYRRVSVAIARILEPA